MTALSLLSSRRALLQTGGGLFGWAFLPRFARAAGRDPRFVVIILRGALDGLSAVGPVGDPEYVGLHGKIALALGGARPALPLDGFFALNPGMPNLHRMFRQKQAAIVHAVATPYRQRSHFDGQDVLESGYPEPGRVDSGWLNRALESLPRGDHVRSPAGLGIGATTPLVIRGSAPVLGWTPEALPDASNDLARRLMALYRHSDPALGRALAEGLDVEKIAAHEAAGGMRPQQTGPGSPAGMRQAAQGAAKLMAAADGPRIAALAFDGWDTHANEGGATGRLAYLLAGLDGAFDEFQKGLGRAWSETTIVAITEFGRTARINGTVGTDHGTATVAFLVGGAVKGGRVIADWPGLKPAALYQNRDLRATTDLRAVLKGLLAAQLGLSAAVLGRDVFPNSSAVKPMQDLVSA